MRQRLNISSTLKNDILACHFPPGTLLQEQQLGERYGCSRTPAREALRSLVEEGLVERVGRFYYVKRYSVEEVRELYELREVLECAATRLATLRAADAELLELRRHVFAHAKMLREQGRETVSEYSTFHRQIGRLSGNTLISAELASLQDKIIFISTVVDITNREELIVAHDDHCRAVEAMVRRNPDAAVAEIRFHIRNAVSLYVRHLGETGPVDAMYRDDPALTSL